MLENMELSTYLKPDCMVDLETIGKEALLKQLTDLLAKSDKVTDPVQMKKAIFAREKTMSTAIGNGIAVPHARTSAATDFVIAFARVGQGMDFEAEDRLPVKLVFMIVCSDKQDKQMIKLLSRLVLRLKNDEFVDELLAANSTQDIYRLISDTK